MPIPVRNHAQEYIYPVQEILSVDLLPHVEQEQQICSVSELKTNSVVSIFLEVQQQVYYLVFFPLSGKNISGTEIRYCVVI